MVFAQKNRLKTFLVVGDEKPLLSVLSAIATIFFLISISYQNTAIANDEPEESDVKVAFIYNFVRFTLWPTTAFEGPVSPYTLCLVGRDTLGTSIRSIEIKKARNRSFSVQYKSSVKGIRSCHIVYVGDWHEKTAEDVINSTRGLPILTIGDPDGFAERGGVIGFFKEGNRIRFKVNLQVANRNRIKISSKLLRLAVIVNEIESLDR